MDANTLMNLQSSVSGDVTRTLSTVDILASLKALDYDHKDSAIAEIARNEKAYLTQAMSAINGNAMLSLKFGNGLEGAMAVAGLLKQRNSQRIYEQALDPYAERVNSKELELLSAGKSSVSFGSSSSSSSSTRSTS
jgi:hypothetical protein